MEPMSLGVGPEVGRGVESMEMGCNVEPRGWAVILNSTVVWRGVELVYLLPSKKINTNFCPYKVKELYAYEEHSRRGAKMDLPFSD